MTFEQQINKQIDAYLKAPKNHDCIEYENLRQLYMEYYLTNLNANNDTAVQMSLLRQKKYN